MRVLTPEAAQTRVRSTPGRDLELVVHLSGPEGAVRWYKDGERLASQGRVQLEQAGARHALRVRGTQSRDAGEYLCDAPHDSRIFLVSVEGNAPSHPLVPGSPRSTPLTMLGYTHTPLTAAGSNQFMHNCSLERGSEPPCLETLKQEEA